MSPRSWKSTWPRQALIGRTISVSLKKTDLKAKFETHVSLMSITDRQQRVFQSNFHILIYAHVFHFEVFRSSQVGSRSNHKHINLIL